MQIVEVADEAIASISLVSHWWGIGFKERDVRGKASKGEARANFESFKNFGLCKSVIESREWVRVEMNGVEIKIKCTLKGWKIWPKVLKKMMNCGRVGERERVRGGERSHYSGEREGYQTCHRHRWEERGKEEGGRVWEREKENKKQNIWTIKN